MCAIMSRKRSFIRHSHDEWCSFGFKPKSAQVTFLELREMGFEKDQRSCDGSFRTMLRHGGQSCY